VAVATGNAWSPSRVARGHAPSYCSARPPRERASAPRRRAGRAPRMERASRPRPAVPSGGRPLGPACGSEAASATRPSRCQNGGGRADADGDGQRHREGELRVAPQRSGRTRGPCPEASTGLSGHLRPDSRVPRRPATRAAGPGPGRGARCRHEGCKSRHAHDEPPRTRPRDLFDVEGEDRDDVRMDERGHGTGLPARSADRGLVLQRLLGQDLQHDVAIWPEVGAVCSLPPSAMINRPLSPEGQHVQPSHREMGLPKQVLGRSRIDELTKLLEQRGIEMGRNALHNLFQVSLQ
jgi:hypothetical protein